MGRLSHSVVKDHDKRICRSIKVHQRNIKPLHAKAWISYMCMGCGWGKCPSCKKDHQQKYRCRKNSRKYNVALI